MKDYLHLFGGMCAAILALALYIFAFGAVMRCFAEERITYPASDGVNEVTARVTDSGVVVPESVTLAYVEPSPPYIPQSGEHCVIADVEYVLIAAQDWVRITNAVARLEAVAERRWANEHKTAEGRRAWHGAPTNRVVEAASVTWQYADGFTYTEQAEPSRRASPAVERMKKAAERPQGASAIRPRVNVPPRLRAKQEAISARPASKEVNATFGPGGKLLKTEGGK